jgi:hypothetical protein
LNPADGCLFVGSTLCDRTEFVRVEFGGVRFDARVISRREFSISSTSADVLELRRKLVVGSLFAPLVVAQEYLGNAWLETLTAYIDRENGKDVGRLDIEFVHSEVMPP